MKRIIDISEEQYKWVMNVNKSYDYYGLSDFIDLIANSTPLNEVEAEDYISRNEVDKLAYRYLREATDNHVAFYEDFLDLPSVYPKSELSNNSPKVANKNGEYKADDCISRAEAIKIASGFCHPSNIAKELAELPSMGRYDPYTDKFIKE